MLRPKQLILPLGIILLAVLLRVLPHPPNVAPIAAMALFGGAYLDKRFAIILPLLALFLSDIFIGFHNTMPFVYVSFLLTAFIGMWLRKRQGLFPTIGATLISSLLFFLITNFGVWFVTDLYPRNLAGLSQSYLMALPFFRNTIIGDFLYVGMLFGGYEVVASLLRAKSAKIKTKIV